MTGLGWEGVVNGVAASPCPWPLEQGPPIECAVAPCPANCVFRIEAKIGAVIVAALILWKVLS